MSDPLHPYDITLLDYLYVLTALHDGTIRIDNVGYHKVVATDSIISLECGQGYKECFDHLSVSDRKIEAWGDSNLFETYSQTVGMGTEFEPHKHPRILRRQILRDESFEWFCSTSYHLKTPTKEVIDQTRSEYWWDSKNKPLLAFYHHARTIESDRLALYVPSWLKELHYSYTYEEFSPDGPHLDEQLLKNDGLEIQRTVEDNMNPRTHANDIQSGYSNNFLHWGDSYTKISLEATGRDLRGLAVDAVMTVGVLSPTESEWRSHA